MVHMLTKQLANPSSRRTPVIDAVMNGRVYIIIAGATLQVVLQQGVTSNRGDGLQCLKFEVLNVFEDTSLYVARKIE